MPNTSISFPSSPTQGQQYTYGSTTYIYDGTSWSVDSTLVNSPLKLDSTNNRVGINNTTPTVALDVTGAIKGSTTLQITGATTLSSTLNVTGATTLSSTLDVTGDLAVNGGDITTTAAAATVFNTTATTLNVGGAATTVALGEANGTVSVGNLSMNAGFGSIAPVYGCRAWVNCVGTAAVTTTPWGGTNTASRTAGSTTCTITTTNPHGLSTNHRVHTTATPVIDAAAAMYAVTVTSPTTFTVTTTATTALSAAAILFNWQTVRASGNVLHVVGATAAGTYAVNLATAMPDANYAVIGSSGGTNSTSNGAVYLYDQLYARNSRSFPLLLLNAAGAAVAGAAQINVAVFR